MATLILGSPPNFDPGERRHRGAWWDYHFRAPWITAGYPFPGDPSEGDQIPIDFRDHGGSADGPLADTEVVD